MALYESVTGRRNKPFHSYMDPSDIGEYNLSAVVEIRRARQKAEAKAKVGSAEYGVAEETPRVTRSFQFKTYGSGVSETIFVISSNVVSMTYNAQRQHLTVEFQRWVKGVGRVIGGGAKYLYYDISLEEWKSAKLAGSKGKWVWAVLRRGGKAYMRVR